MSFLIFSRTSHGPRATYSRNSSADTSCTRKSIFHIRGRSVGSYSSPTHQHSPSQLCRPGEKCTRRTTADGIPSTRMSLRSFRTESSTSWGVRTFVESLNWFRILLKECAVAFAGDDREDEEEEEDGAIAAWLVEAS